MSTQAAVRVYTLGRFRIEVEGAPLKFGRKAPRKPLDLLKVLIAYGGEQVSADRIADILWPDADGDHGQAAFRQALSRLRKLIGKSAILGEGGSLTLNRQVCWIDALAFVSLPAHEALPIYQGDFAPGCDLPPVIGARDRLRDLFNRRSIQPRVASSGGQVCIGILPFEDLSPSGNHQRLAEAIRQTVASLLGALPQASLRLLDGANGDASLRYLLRGSVAVSAGAIRTNVRVVDGRTGAYAWSEDIDQALVNFGQTRDQIAIQVAQGLARKLIAGESATLLLQPDLQVWKAMSLALVILNRQTRHDFLRAQALVRRALQAQPDEPAILSTQANMHVQASWKRWSPNPRASLRKGEQLLRMLAKRHGERTGGLHALSWASALRGEVNEGLRLAHRRLELLPEHYLSHTFVGITQLYGGRYEQALEKINDAIRLRPQPLHWLLKDRAVLQFSLGRYEEAASGLTAMLTDGVHRDCALLDSRMIHVASLAAAGKLEQARFEANATVAAHPSVSTGRWCEWQFAPYQDRRPALKMERLLASAGMPY